MRVQSARLESLSAPGRDSGWRAGDRNEAGDANAVHDGAQLLVYGSTMAIAPGDYTPPYRLTVEVDLADHTYNTIYCRNDGVSHNYENGDVIRMGFWAGAGGSLVLNIAGNDHSQYGVPMPGRDTDPNVYRFIIEENDELLEKAKNLKKEISKRIQKTMRIEDM